MGEPLRPVTDVVDVACVLNEGGTVTFQVETPKDPPPPPVTAYDLYQKWFGANG